MAKTSLNPILNVKDEIFLKKTQSMQMKVQTKFYFDNIWKPKYEMKQGYDTKLYFKLMFTFVYNPLGT